MRRQSTANTPRTSRSRVTNGKALFITGKATSAYARRLTDILSAIVADLGGADQLSEAECQLARRAASLSVACERLEASICGAGESTFTDATGGLSPYQILTEASRALHGIARVRGGDGIREMANKPDAELSRITDLLTRAADIAAKTISAGSERSADLQLLGELSDRLGRAFVRIGLKRRPKDVESLSTYLERRARELPEEPLEAAGAADMVPGLSDSGNGFERTSDALCGGARPSTGEGGTP